MPTNQSTLDNMSFQRLVEEYLRAMRSSVQPDLPWDQPLIGEGPVERAIKAGKKEAA